jgi:glycerol dehydrogenase-like iron-containing ADH family enzyme
MSMCVSLVAGRWRVPAPAPASPEPTPHATCTPAIAGAGGAAVLVPRSFASTMAAHLVHQAACRLQNAARVSHQHGHRVPASRLTRLELARLQWAMVLGDARCRCWCSRSRRHVRAFLRVCSLPLERREGEGHRQTRHEARATATARPPDQPTLHYLHYTLPPPPHRASPLAAQRP